MGFRDRRPIVVVEGRERKAGRKAETETNPESNRRQSAGDGGLTGL